jgi:pimeloyl-ACP methyl ester carboxylesterase
MSEQKRVVRRCGSSGHDIELCYQAFGNPTHSAVILVGGLNMQSYAWDESFCEQIVRLGFYVIRFDNRDIGHSTKIETIIQRDSASMTTSPLFYHQEEQQHENERSSSARNNAAGDEMAHLIGVGGGGSPGASSSASSATGCLASSTTTSSQQCAQSVGVNIAPLPFNNKASASSSSTWSSSLWRHTRNILSYIPLIRNFTNTTNNSTKTSSRRIRTPAIVPWKLFFPRWMAWGECLPYELDDMAFDALALLDCLHVQKAHVVGVSMGGMIAQLMAIHAPQRVQTLTCIMSSTNARDLPHPALWVKLWMLRKPASGSSREELVDFRVKALQGLLYGCMPVDEGYLKRRIAMSLNRSAYPDGLIRQAAAIMRAYPRDEALKQVTCPALILHGQSDVLCRVEHGYRLGKVLPNAKLVVFKNMGHHLNPAFFDSIVEEFVDLVEREAELQRQQLQQ